MCVTVPLNVADKMFVIIHLCYLECIFKVCVLQDLRIFITSMKQA